MYSISCSCGQNYIGETKRNLEARLKEHQTATRQGETNKSAIAEHAWEEQHQPQSNNIKMIDHVRNENILLIKEGLHITMAHQPSLINQDRGIAALDYWRPLLKKHFVNDDVAPPSNITEFGIANDIYLAYCCRGFVLTVYCSDEDCSYTVETLATLKRRKKHICTLE